MHNILYIPTKKILKHNSTITKSLDAYKRFAPSQIVRGKGVFLYDVSGTEYLDTGMALGSISLGYCYDSVDDFVISQLKKGVNFSRPSILEEQFTHLIQEDLGDDTVTVRYAKSSSILLSVIPRIARYVTKKTLVVFPEHCFLGNTDCFLSQASNFAGILKATRDLTKCFSVTNCNSLEDLFEQHGKDIACLVMEPYRETPYSQSFYSTLSSLRAKYNFTLVFDEIVTGYRFYLPLAQKITNCQPDITVVGKAFANGYALSAVILSKSVDAEIVQGVKNGDIFDFSTTHADETLGLAACIKTIELYREHHVVKQLNEKGNYLMKKMQKILSRLSLTHLISIRGHPTYFRIVFHNSEKYIQKELYKKFFQDHILFRGVISISLSHTYSNIDRILHNFEYYCNTIVRYF